MKPFHHAKAAAARWGGVFADYLPVHDFIDHSAMAHPDVRHRAILHHTGGVELAARTLGESLRLSDGAAVPVREVALAHLREDCAGRVPEPGDYLELMRAQDWMRGDALLRMDAEDHARRDVAKWGGRIEDYLPIHALIDAGATEDPRTGALMHHSFGAFLTERVFGSVLENAAGRLVPVRSIAERHIKKDFRGRLPAVSDWLHAMAIQPWMHGTDAPDLPGGRPGPARTPSRPAPPSLPATCGVITP